ncbi:chorismate-binding protein [Actinosynnema sp. NPDC091369]
MLRTDDEVRELLAGLVDPPHPPAFAVLCRDADEVDVLVGTMTTAPSTAAIPTGPVGTVALLPFRQLTERGLPCRDDGTPLRVLLAAERHRVSRAVLERVLPRGAAVTGAGFDEEDESYAERVRRVVAGRPEDVTHCLLRRGYTARLERPGSAAALALLGGLLHAEEGAYWTFAVHEGGPDGLALVGAPPQGQVRLAGGEAVLHPTCGTYRYPTTGPTAEGLAAFLHDDKEFDELAATVDAELAALCALEPDEVVVDGPVLLPMSRLAHTGCVVRATGVPDARRVLAGTMFAATAIGNPVAGALRVVAEHEPDGRGYYGGAVVLLEPDGSLDAATLIRTAEVDGSGLVRVSVGATVGDRSSPAAEAAETRVKVDALLSALRGGPASERGAPGDHEPPSRQSGAPDAEPVLEALAARRGEIAPHWTHPPPRAAGSCGELLVVDLGDGGAAALAHLARRRGWRPVVRAAADLRDTDLGVDGLDAVRGGRFPGRVSLAHGARDADLARGAGGTALASGTDVVGDRGVGGPGVTGPVRTILLGPGPGHPDDPGLERVRRFACAALHAGYEVRGVGLGFQLLARLLGFPVAPRRTGNGPRQVEVFGVRHTPVLRNRFAVTGPAPAGVRAWSDDATGEVLALRATGVAGVQFRPEAVLARGGVDVLDALLRPGLPTTA